MQNNFLVLLPPVIALGMAFITRRIVLSLSTGIVSAAFLATSFSLKNTIISTITNLWKTSELGNITSLKGFLSSGNLLIIIFLLTLGVIITLINHTGATKTYGNFVEKKLKNSSQAEYSSLALSSFLFVDDYFSSLATGSVMYAVTDKFKIPRAKLAFLVDSMAASLCALSPISSWMAAIITPLSNAGITDQIKPNTIIATDTFWVYLQVLPFIFYSIILILSIWFIVIRKISFGSMRKHEIIAQKTGNLFGGRAPVKRKIRQASNKNIANNSIVDFVLPIIWLSTSVVLSLLFTGNFWLFGGNNSFVKAFQSAEISPSLFFSGVITLTLSLIYYNARKKIHRKELPTIILEGVNLMLPAIVVLLLAWTLGNILKNDLHTGQYLANKLVGSVNLNLLPVIFFIISTATSLCTGSAWGTVAIIVPIAVPMLLSFLQLIPPVIASNIPILFPVIGAIVSGAIIGDHVSPLSDTTVMASASTGCNLMDHAQTQLTYSIPIIFSTAIAFLASGFLIQYGIAICSICSLLIGALSSFTTLQILNRKS